MSQETDGTPALPDDESPDSSKRLVEFREYPHRYVPFELGPGKLLAMLSHKEKTEVVKRRGPPSPG